MAGNPHWRRFVLRGGRDAGNLASRLESITKEYGAAIIVGEGTKNAVPDVVFRELDRVRVKGKDEAVAIFEPFGMQGKVDKSQLEEIKLYTQFLRLYRAQDWDQAELQLFNLQKQLPASTLYMAFMTASDDCMKSPSRKPTISRKGIIERKP